MGQKSLVEQEVSHHVARIYLNHSEKRNALSTQMRADLKEHLDAARNNPLVKVVVLSHRDTVFCSGMDLSEISQDTIDGALSDLNYIFELLTTFEKPTICQLSGTAVAGGLGLVAASDFVIATSDVKFSFSEVRIGVSPAIISPYVLKKMDRSKAAEYLLTGIPFTATQAQESGLVNWTCSRDDLDATTDKYISELLKIDLVSFAKTKSLLNDIATNSASSDDIRRLSVEMFLSDNAQHGREALKSKTQFRWDLSGDAK